MKHLPRRPATRCLRWATLLAVVFALALASRRYRVFVVDGDSMAPGLHTGDLLLVARGAYRDSLPRRGDRVVARLGDEHIVKRVVGLPGEAVAIRRGHLHVDGVLQPEPYDTTPGFLEIAEGLLASDRVALAGDNRTAGTGIVHAVVPLEAIEGHVVGAVRWPLALFRVPLTAQ